MKRRKSSFLKDAECQTLNYFFGFSPDQYIGSENRVFYNLF